MESEISFKIPRDIIDIGFTPEILREFENRSLREEDYSRITITNRKVIFEGSSLGLETYIIYFFQLSLNDFPKGFHIHEPCDPTEDFSSKDLMLCKLDANLVMGKDNIYIDGQYYRFEMPEVKLDNLISLKIQLERDRTEKKILIETEDNYPSPAISASGSTFCKLGRSLFLFNKLPAITNFVIFDDLEFSKR